MELAATPPGMGLQGRAEGREEQEAWEKSETALKEYYEETAQTPEQQESSLELLAESSKDL